MPDTAIQSASIQAAVSIDAAAINNFVAKAVMESSIGEALSKVINDQVKDLRSTYDRAMRTAVEEAIKQQIQKIIMVDHRELIDKIVRERITEDMAAKIINELFERLSNTY